MSYVDGFVLPIPKKNLAAYKKLAKLASRVWLDHGALQYVEAVGEDLALKYGKPFPKAFKLRPGETVVFAWISYRNKAHRNRVNAKVMTDPRLLACMNKPLPFDMKTMCCGGFQSLVSVQA